MTEQSVEQRSAEAVARIRAARRVMVQTSLGEVVEMRGLSLGEIAAHAGVLVDLTKLADLTPDATPGDLTTILGGKKALDAIAKVICVAAVCPRIGDNAETGLVAGDFPVEDQLLMFSEVMKLSGRSKEAADRVRP